MTEFELEELVFKQMDRLQKKYDQENSRMVTPDTNDYLSQRLAQHKKEEAS